MGIMHCIEIILNDFLQEKSIQLILQRAQEAQYVLYPSEGDECVEREKNLAITPERAVELVLKRYRETKYAGSIILKKNNTEILLSFDIEDTYLKARLIPLVYHWEKEFPNGEYQKDFARYISLLLTITQDFPMINLGIDYK